MIAFDTPWLLYLAPGFAVVLGGLAYWARAARVRRAGRWSPHMMKVAAGVGRASVIWIALAGFFVAVGLAGPRFGRRVVTTEAKALNLVMAVDISRSMLAEDVEPSRLERVQREADRLVQDMGGDRIGLVAFAGQSYILSPLTVDDGALRLLIDGLHPDMASAGGTSLAPVLRQSRQLLTSGEGVADRVLVLFTDGEAMDSMPEILEQAREYRREGIRLILVAEGGLEPATIPVRDPDGVLLGNQRDEFNNVVETMRRDDLLAQVADAAQGTFVSAELGDQAGAVRDLLAAFKRAPQATTTASEDVSRAWIPSLIAALLLFAQTVTRRTAALAMLAFVFAAPRPASAQGLRNPADDAWSGGDFETAAQLYLRQVQAGLGGDTSWLNLGTAAMAVGDTALARRALSRAGQSIEPELRFRALYNMGWLSLQLAERDSANRNDHLDAARATFREALLLKPDDGDAKWNYELARRLMPPPEGGGGQQQPPPSGGGAQQPDQSPLQGLTREQAEQILNSMLEEERRTRDAVNRRRSRSQSRAGRRNW